MKSSDGAPPNLRERPPAADPPARACPACGGAARRESARFCATCGRQLDHDSYFPADSLRSSYHRQRLSAPAAAAGDQSLLRRGGGGARAVSRPAAKLFGPRHTNATAMALAFVTYALVPYLGILFCPGALLMGGVALARARRASPRRRPGDWRAAFYSFLLALVVFALQIFLWWILYKVPEWARP